MIHYREIEIKDAYKIKEIDRSEKIELIYQMNNGQMEENKAGHECSNWDSQHLEELINRFRLVLENGGKACGAFDEDRMVGFGVLAHQFRGKNKDQLQIDLMYVSRDYRRQGIGKIILNELCNEAVQRGAKYLYISSTETESAVNFYKSCGSELTDEVDQELFELEPKDIHMKKKL